MISQENRRRIASDLGREIELATLSSLHRIHDRLGRYREQDGEIFTLAGPLQDVLAAIMEVYESGDLETATKAKDELAVVLQGGGK